MSAIVHHTLDFEVPLALSPARAIDFVRDVRQSLAHALFLRDLRVSGGTPLVVEATLPINAALFGQRDVPFRSALTPTPTGARLEGVEIEPVGPGWALVSGEAMVRAAPSGSVVHYDFSITVHVELPVDGRWGGRALTRMIEYAAATVLARVTSAFPEAIARAAREAEGATSALAVTGAAGP
ncbi:hypothetical protein BH23DEI1_BH23DEI1_09740 [soil metagenome]